MELETGASYCFNEVFVKINVVTRVPTICSDNIYNSCHSLYNSVVNRLYSIPDTHVSEGLVAPDVDCRQDTPNKIQKEGSLMINKMKAIKHFIIRYSFVIVLFLSVFHIGIAYIHSLESGRAD